MFKKKPPHSKETPFRSSVERGPKKQPGGLLGRALGALAAATSPNVGTSPQIIEAQALPPQHSENIKAVQLASEQNATFRGSLSRAIRQFQELREAGNGKTSDEYKRDADRVIPNKEGVPILTSVMRATIRDPRRVSVDGRDSQRGLSSNPFMEGDSKINHIGILRATRVSTDPSKPYTDDRIALTVESTDERDGSGRVHGISFVTDPNGEKEYVRVTVAGYNANGKLLPADVIYPSDEEMGAFVDMISAAAMDSHPHEDLGAQQPPHQAE